MSSMDGISGRPPFPQAKPGGEDRFEPVPEPNWGWQDQNFVHPDAYKGGKPARPPAGNSPANAVYTNFPFWLQIPWAGRPLTLPAPPYSLVLAPSATADLVNYEVPDGWGYIIDEIVLQVEEALGLPLVTWRVLKNGTPFEGMTENFTVDTPLSTDVAQHQRLTNGQTIRIEATNTSILIPFTPVARITGWLYHRQTYEVGLQPFDIK